MKDVSFLQPISLRFTALGLEQRAPALSRGASLLQKAITVALDWSDPAQWETAASEGVNAGTPQTTKLAGKQTMYPPKACSSPACYQWLFKEI